VVFRISSPAFIEAIASGARPARTCAQPRFSSPYAPMTWVGAAWTPRRSRDDGSIVETHLHPVPVRGMMEAPDVVADQRTEAVEYERNHDQQEDMGAPEGQHVADRHAHLPKPQLAPASFNGEESAAPSAQRTLTATSATTLRPSRSIRGSAWYEQLIDRRDQSAVGVNDQRKALLEASRAIEPSSDELKRRETAPAYAALANRPLVASWLVEKARSLVAPVATRGCKRKKYEHQHRRRKHYVCFQDWRDPTVNRKPEVALICKTKDWN
jgi:hypothetical protein